MLHSVFRLSTSNAQEALLVGSHALVVNGRYHTRVKNVGNKGGGSMVMTFKKGGVGFTRRRLAGFYRFKIEWSLIVIRITTREI